MIFLVVEILCVGDVIVICTIDFIIGHLFFMTRTHRILFLLIEQLTSGNRPREQVAELIKSREKSILLTPDQVLALLVHAHTLNQVDVGEWNHSDLVVTTQKGESVAEFALAQQVALTTDGGGQSVTFDFALEQSDQVVYVEATSYELVVLFLLFSTFLQIYYLRRKSDGITDSVKVSLMGGLTAANLEAFENQSQFHLSVVDPDLLLCHLDKVIDVPAIIFRREVE